MKAVDLSVQNVDDLVSLFRAVCPNANAESAANELRELIIESSKVSSRGERSKAILDAVVRYSLPPHNEAFQAVAEQAESILAEVAAYRERARASADADAAEIIRKAQCTASSKLSAIEAERSKFEQARHEYEQKLEELKAPTATVSVFVESVLKSAGYGTDKYGQTREAPSMAVAAAFITAAAMLGTNPVQFNPTIGGKQ